MEPNFIDKIPPPQSDWAQWLDAQGHWLVPALSLFLLIAWPALYALVKRRAFWRNKRDAIVITRDSVLAPGWVKGPLLDVAFAWSATNPQIQVWVYLVPEGLQAMGRAAELLAMAWKPGQVRTTWGVTSPSVRHEYGMEWLTKLIRWASRGRTGVSLPAYEVMVREKPDDPEGGRALAHELARHVWAHSNGFGWNRAELDYRKGDVTVESLKGKLIQAAVGVPQ